MTAFRFVDAQKAGFPISMLCTALGVSRSGYYAWSSRGPSPRELANRRLTEQIKAVHAESRQTYGVRRVHAALAYRGHSVSRGRVERLMRKAGLYGLIRNKRLRTTIKAQGVKSATDLVSRDFMPDGPNKLWVADITYLRTFEGWLYLAVVIGFSRRVVGYAIDDTMRAEMAVEALEMAVWRRDPYVGVVHHSDQGSQYTALIFGERCREAGIEVSMGSRGCAYDNAVAESFFQTLKTEPAYRRSWPTKEELRISIFEWIEVFYNRQQLHSTLGYRSPEEFERMSSSDEAEVLVA